MNDDYYEYYKLRPGVDAIYKETDKETGREKTFYLADIVRPRIQCSTIPTEYGYQAEIRHRTGGDFMLYWCTKNTMVEAFQTCEKFLSEHYELKREKIVD